MDDLAVLAAILAIDVDDGEEVVVLGVGIDAVDVEVLLRPIEPLDERRQAGLGVGGHLLIDDQSAQYGGANQSGDDALGVGH